MDLCGRIGTGASALASGLIALHSGLTTFASEHEMKERCIREFPNGFSSEQIKHINEWKTVGELLQKSETSDSILHPLQIQMIQCYEYSQSWVVPISIAFTMSMTALATYLFCLAILNKNSETISNVKTG